MLSSLVLEVLQLKVDCGFRRGVPVFSLDKAP
jgi:hypothetical protein